MTGKSPCTTRAGVNYEQNVIEVRNRDGTTLVQSHARSGLSRWRLYNSTTDSAERHDKNVEDDVYKRDNAICEDLRVRIRVIEAFDRPHAPRNAANQHDPSRQERKLQPSREARI